MENKQLLDFSKWGNIYGVLAIVSGALTCLSIIGAITGVPMIFAGMHIKKGALIAKSIINKTAGGEVVSIEDYRISLEEVGRYSKIMAILTIVSIVLGIVSILCILFPITLIPLFLKGPSGTL